MTRDRIADQAVPHRCVTAPGAGRRNARAVGCLLAAMALLLGACDAPTVPAAAHVYPFSLQTAGGDLVMHWPTGATVGVYVVPAGTAAANLGAAVEAGAAEWNAVALFGEYRLARVSRLADANAVVVGSDAMLPVDDAACPPSAGGLAVTTFCLTPDQHGLQVFPDTSGGPAHVQMLVTVLASYAADPAAARRVVAHELGHVLGIARHSPDASDLMYSLPAIDHPSPADAATVRALYDSPAAVQP